MTGTEPLMSLPLGAALVGALLLVLLVGTVVREHRAGADGVPDTAELPGRGWSHVLASLVVLGLVGLAVATAIRFSVLT